MFLLYASLNLSIYCQIYTSLGTCFQMNTITFAGRQRKTDSLNESFSYERLAIRSLISSRCSMKMQICRYPLNFLYKAKKNGCFR